jgi:hypothetical protein
MLESDQETVLRALEDARRILGRCIAGQRNATRAVERLLAVLDEIEVVDALERMNRLRILRLVDLTYIGLKNRPRESAARRRFIRVNLRPPLQTSPTR